ncbi:hypothetical protein [Fibrivirga algicola]|uniref:Uncharacterized protein n=1 Tax=Fibrivirga algicola TaxID=2950420 RepID=A0ABX0QA02_9BACT|nr:hypothetical protein [Fibrivirga algicola]NID09026.1 hypothetical protein [Fibrivirga algicola]
MKLLLFSLLLMGLTPVRLLPMVDPDAPTPCLMSNGQPRPYPCEFTITAIRLMGKNNEVVGTLTPGSTTVKVPKSKAVSHTSWTGGESFMYNASLVFRRINTASFPPKPVSKGLPSLGFYTISTARVTSPITPSELTLSKRVDVAPTVPGPGIRSNQANFSLQLNYSTGSGATIIAPIRYVQIANPITFNKPFPASINQFRDKSEAFMEFLVTVDKTK